MNHYIYPGLKDSIKENVSTCKKHKIISVVCDYFSISLSDLNGLEKHRRFVQARQVLCFFLNKYTKLTREQIGKIINRDHSTVTYSIGTINDLCFSDVNWSKRIYLIEKMI